MKLFLYLSFCLTFVASKGQPVYGDRYGAYPPDPSAFNREYGFFVSLPVRSRAIEIDRFTERHELASEQIRQLAMLFPNDYEKSKYLGFVYRRGRVYDIQHFHQNAAVFSTQAARDAFYRFLNKKGINFSGSAPVVPGPDRLPKAPSTNPVQTVSPDLSANKSGTSVTQEELRQAKTAIQSKDFDSGKLEAAKQIFQGRLTTVGQVAEIMRLFIYDDNRLDFAKYALSGTSDKENYGKLAKELTLASNKSALTKILDEQKIGR